MHPHEGVEFVTYQLDGQMDHREPDGTHLALPASRAMHLFAGSGVVHSETPVGHEPSHGLQLWIALPPRAANAPARREAADVAAGRSEGGVSIKHVAGEQGAVQTEVPVIYIDVSQDPGSVVRHAVPRGWTAIAQVLTGDGSFGDAAYVVRSSQFAVFADGDVVTVRAGAGPLRYVLLAGQPVAA